MKLFKLQIVFVFILGLLPSLFLANSLVHAQAGTGVIRVAATGADSSGCGSVTVPCRTIQYAVNLAAAGDEIHIAQGTYSDVNSHVTPGWYEWPATIQQIVYLDKSVTLKGGYNAAFSARDSDPNLTVLDAQGQGRGIVIMPDVTVTVDGLRVTGGDNANQGGTYDESSYYDVGAGIYIRDATVTIDNCQIDNNVSSQDGGGIYVYQGDV
ncbi:MAG: DUF1565 domain-containing protein, partial [Chloroflexi bacterium]|nr:DUF1565 domain-containing protein [Chloroflexota bacterium]